MPQVAPPEQLTPFTELRHQWLAEAGEVHPRVRESLLRTFPIEFRPVYPWNPLKPAAMEARQCIWFKVTKRAPDAPLLHQCLLAYASDFNLIGTALRPHAESWYSPKMAVASIDHAIWFHRPARVDEWLLYAMDSPTAQGARGMSRGLIFDAGGKLVASVAQEGLMRRRDARPPKT
jgi:acyl-CoA thioesterase II